MYKLILATPMFPAGYLLDPDGKPPLILLDIFKKHPEWFEELTVEEQT